MVDKCDLCGNYYSECKCKMNIRPFIELVKERGNYKAIYLCNERITAQICRRYTKIIFVFGDNVQREGYGGQAIIRDEPNSFGIRTKKAPTTKDWAYFTDDNLVEFSNLVKNDLKHLKELQITNPIAFLSSGYGNGMAELPTRAPQCYDFLRHQINLFIGRKVF